jgi:hypothetical protein
MCVNRNEWYILLTHNKGLQAKHTWPYCRKPAPLMMSPVSPDSLSWTPIADERQIQLSVLVQASDRVCVRACACVVVVTLPLYLLKSWFSFSTSASLRKQWRTL